MDFETRLGLFIPLATGLKVNKKDKLWDNYKKSKEIRNKVTHSGTRVTRKQARFVIDTVYEWIEYLNQAQEALKDHGRETTETLGRFIQASARLERVIYSAVVKSGADEKQLRRKSPPLEELRRISLVDDTVFNELYELRSLRNKAVHAHPNDSVIITESNVERLNQMVDEIEIKLNQPV